jgi:hypothetical protein
MPDRSLLPAIASVQALEKQLNDQELLLGNEVLAIGVLKTDNPPKQSNFVETQSNIDADKLGRLKVAEVKNADRKDGEAFSAFVAPLVADADPLERAQMLIGPNLTEVILLRKAGAPAAPASPVVLSWDNKTERMPWSNQLIACVSAKKAELDKGNADTFIAGYNGLAADMQVKFWAELLVAMAKFESGWNPHDIFQEPPPLTEDSVGLLQLSYGDQNNYPLEPLNKATRSLEDPLVNLRSGVTIFAKLVAEDKVVTKGGGAKGDGASRYWSVLREGAKHHLAEIKALTKKNVGL